MRGRAINNDDLSTFLMRKQYAEAFLTLPDELAGKVIKNVFRFVDGQRIEDIEDPTGMLLFNIIAAQIEESAQRYLRRKRQSRKDQETE